MDTQAALVLIILASLAGAWCALFIPSKNGKWLGIFTVRSVVRWHPVKNVPCKRCQGHGEYDITTGLPVLLREVNANAVDCEQCGGFGYIKVRDYEAESKE